MQRSSAAMAKKVYTKISSLYNNNVRKRKSQSQAILRQQQPPFDVFISHRGIDTRRNVAGILYDHLSGVGLRPFLDSKSLSPGDNLINKINFAVKTCRVGIPVFSPRYCESYYCLYELALMLRSNKCIVPIFWNVKPSELRVPNNGSSLDKRLHRFAWAIDEAKCTVGLSFDSVNGDWSELLSNASDAVIKLGRKMKDPCMLGINQGEII